jgi:SAM-dependent methyltransferase
MNKLDPTQLVVDIGCGNGRNSAFLRDHGFEVRPFDMSDDYGEPLILGHKRFPIADHTAGTVLANYVFMFLDTQECHQVITEIKRIAQPGCVMVCELYSAKDSQVPDLQDMPAFQQQLFDQLDWQSLRYSKNRFIAQKPH